MAITGTFLADFKSFNDAVKNADVALKGMETNAGKVGDSLNRMVDSFSGRKIIQEATLATAAIERIGGASKLTESEQRRVNATVTEAISKYSALGKQAPPDMVALAEATKHANRETSLITATFGKMAGMLTAGALLGGVTALGRSFLSTASGLTDLSARTGIGTTELQRFDYAGKLVGVTLDSVTTAVAQMQRRLASNEDGAVDAVKRLGLNFSELRALDPAKQFEAIAAQISRIPDPAERTRVAMEIFGRSGAELLPLLRTNLQEVGDEAERLGAVIGEDVIAAGDRFDDMLTKTIALLKASAFNALAPAIDKWNKFTGAVTQARLELEALAGINIGPPKVPTAPGLAVQSGLGPAGDFKAGIEAEQDLARQVKNTAELLKLQREAWAANLAEAKKQEEEYDRLVAAGEKYERLMVSTTDLLTKSSRSSVDARVAQSQLTSELHKGAVAWLAQNAPGQSSLALITELKNIYPEAAIETKNFTINLTELSQALANLSQAGGGLGAMASGLATLVNSINTAQKSIEQMKTGFEAFSAGGMKNILAGIGSLTSGILGIVSAAMAAGRALVGLFDRDKGRDLVEEFAKSFGGFDALQAKLEEMGEAGAGLWEKLTQGVGRNNPEQAQRVIAEVEAAIQRWEQSQANANVSTEAGAQATIETAAEAAKALDEINEKLKGNADEWGSWSDRVTGYLQGLADTIRNLPVPAVPGVETPAVTGATFGGGQAHGGDYLVRRPTLFLAGEAGPERATFTPAGRSARSAQPALINIQLGSHTVWRALLDVAAEEGLS